MPFQIVRNDITAMQTDAIVNAANREPLIGGGVDLGIYQKAGPGLLEARKKIGVLLPGEAAITPGFSLKAKYIIHAVGPCWRGGGFGEEKQLRACYDACLGLAAAFGCESVAFPLLAAGNLGFPMDKAMQTAISAFSQFLMTHEMMIYLVVFRKDSFLLSEKLFQNVASYIDETYIRDTLEQEYSPGGSFPAEDLVRQRAGCRCLSSSRENGELNWQELLLQRDAGFAETLVSLIEKSGKKNSEVYKKANVDKKLFSKIINNVSYHPSKQTALAFAIALELDLEQTEDLIGRAGYALTRSSKFDIIVEYSIRNRCFDIYSINEVLFQFDQCLLGS